MRMKARHLRAKRQSCTSTQQLPTETPASLLLPPPPEVHAMNELCAHESEQRTCMDMSNAWHSWSAHLKTTTSPTDEASRAVFHSCTHHVIDTDHEQSIKMVKHVHHMGVGHDTHCQTSNTS